MKAIYLASGNEHKAREFQALAEQARLGISVLSARALGGMPPVPEDTGTFVGNARQKAQALLPRLPPEDSSTLADDSGLQKVQALLSRLPRGNSWALADDSGLCVDALGGEPGVDSAVYAGLPGDPAANLAKLVLAMRDVPEGKRAAHFICVLVLASPDGAMREFTGRCDGRLLFAPRGRNGFGYDPLFAPQGYDLSFAELDSAQKNTLSHRACAWGQLVEHLKAETR